MEENKFNQIIKSETFGLISDFGEMTLDSIIDNNVIKEIPIIGTIAKALSIGISINDKLFIKKLYYFLMELENVDRHIILREIQYIDDSPKYKQKVGEKLLEIITRIDSDEKPKIIGKLFKNFISKNIKYYDFLKLSNIVEKALYYDLILLKECKNNNFYIDLDEELYNLGLIDIKKMGNFDSTEIEDAEYDNITYIITKRGNLLLEYGLK
ncbi:hypothetical protein C1637_13970 [Chryseobacterium lactis]|uniref:DUF4393 domain-containing protein n=1 Tax=Chryseobacterium lactis TaxID=1241981 RepID=A0A3G6RMF2_CHRLC|nr:hypothetical protein [Chryseobacterium lactis]AZA83772.1 hypothetical protein EG342_18595 [Chryseobacterium lactis]AZB04157.1 hypothetical protein EG341_09470 [Chryseobacterium lactis]PNW12934.1 hypothetical protein C1637_13970 [Chryseobacterium lactis]